MKYSFKEILNAEIYESTRVMFVLGKYVWFNNMVCDTLKYMCAEQDNAFNASIGIGDDFGIEESNDGDILTNSVDFSTFMEVIGVASINGKWYCRTEYSTLNKKQKEQLFKYIKEPSDNGTLVITSDDWMQYKDILKNRILSFSKVSHVMQLSFPNKQILKGIVAQSFSERGIEIESSAVDFFTMRMSSAYDKYEEQINSIVDMHKEPILTVKDLKVYMKGIENFIVDDFISELLKPMSSDKTNSKKVLKIMMALEDEFGAKNLLYQLIKKIEEYIEFRLLINTGYIPIGINYFYNDIINKLPDPKKYEKMNEWVFRKRAETASLTSLRDWEYMKLILSKAIENVKISDTELDIKCQKALYELATRSVMTPDRLNNVIGIDNILRKKLKELDLVVYSEADLEHIEEIKRLAESEDSYESDDMYSNNEFESDTNDDDFDIIDDSDESLVIIGETFEDY